MASIYDVTDCGRIYLIDPEDLPTGSSSGSNYADSSVSDTWEECDWSEYVPSGAKAVYVYCQINATDAATESTLILVRPSGSTAGQSRGCMLERIAADLNASGAIYGGSRGVIMVNNGKFEYRRWSAAYPINAVTFVLLGWLEP